MGKRFIAAIGIVLLLVLVGWGAYWYLFERTPEAPPSVVQELQPSEEELRQINVVSVDGKVERRKEKGEWAPVAAGERLDQNEAIRTARGAKAVLDLGETATVSLSERSEFSVKEISRIATKVRLEQGHMSAVVHEKGGSKLRVETSGSDAVAESGAGEFTVLSSGTGQVVVATQKGTVTLTANNQAVQVAAGTQSVVQQNKPPAAPQPIPSSLFLQVGKPDSVVQRERQTTVKGSTTPGAIISINGVSVPVGDDGEFNATVPLREGDNAITVVARDATGKREEESLPSITVDSQAPDVRGSKARWGGR